jgi:hypothetical protein
MQMFMDFSVATDSLIRHFTKELAMKMPLFGLVALVVGCGMDNTDRRQYRHRQRANFDLESEVVVRASWEMQWGVGGLRASDQGAWLLGNATSTYQMTAKVLENLAFTVDDTNFIEPNAPSSGDVSFRSLDITDLKDNNLSVCGPTGNGACSTASIRVYTTGTPGSGLWNLAESYGLPITASGGVVGLGASAAHVIKSVPLSGIRNLKLKDFTSEKSLPIPVSVNFDDAGMGDFSTTVVVEYVL